MRSKWATRVLVAALAVHIVLAALSATNAMRRSDLDRFWELGSAHGRPYQDYEAEYPPGTLLVFRVLARGASGRERFGLSVFAANALADGTIVAALAWGWGVEAAGYYAVSVLPIFTLLLFRADLWSAAIATAAVAWWRHDRDLLAATALPFAIILKLWPLPFAGLVAVRHDGRSPRAIVPIIFASLMAGAFVYWWSFAGWRGLYQVLTFRGARGFHDESLIGAVLYLVDPSSHRQEAGAWRVGATGGVMSIGLLLVGALLSLGAFWRGARQRRIGAGWVAGIGAILVCTTLFSPQFLVWLLPGAAIAWAENDRPCAALTLVAVLVTAVNRIGNEQVVLFVVRNLVVVALTVAAAVALWRPRSTDYALRVSQNQRIQRG